jgi:hypothetical protein
MVPVGALSIGLLRLPRALRCVTSSITTIFSRVTSVLTAAGLQS